MGERSVIELDDMNWEKLVEKEGKPIVVMFYSPSCPHCLAMMPYFEKYADEFKGKIFFARIDVNKNTYAVGRYVLWPLLPSSSSARDAPYKRSWVRYIHPFSRRSPKMRWSMEAHAPRNLHL
jgi:thiol-disulfide isomerase/thioredoxin